MSGQIASIRNSAIRRRAFLFTTAVFGVGLGLQASADTTSNWTIGFNGNWTDAAEWSSNPNYPNNGTPLNTNYDATIGIAGTAAYTVTNAAVNTAVNTLTLNSTNATLLQEGSLTAGFLNITKGALVANGVNQTVSLSTTFMTNDGLLKAVNGSTLTFSTGSANNSAGTIEADSGANVNFVYPFIGTVQLGTLNSNSGTFTLINPNTNLFVLITTPAFTFGTTPTGSWLVNSLEFPGNTLNVPYAQFQNCLFDSCTLASNLTATGNTTFFENPIVTNGHTITANVIGTNARAQIIFQGDNFEVSDELTNDTASSFNINLGGYFNKQQRAYPTVDTTHVSNFTLAANSTMTGYGQLLSRNFTNLGTITANSSLFPMDLGPVLQVAGPGIYGGNGLLVNLGTIQSVDGATVYLQNFGWTNNGILSIGAQSYMQEIGGLTFADGSALDITLAINGGSGLLNSFEGVLDLSHNESLNLTFSGNPIPGDYEIVSYTGTLTGTFANVTPGYIVDYSHPGEILVDVPEPAAFGVLTVCGAFACARRRRRNPREKSTGLA